MAQNKNSTIAITSSSNMGDVASQIEKNMQDINKSIDRINFKEAQRRADEFKKKIESMQDMKIKVHTDTMRSAMKGLQDVNKPAPSLYQSSTQPFSPKSGDLTAQAKAQSDLNKKMVQDLADANSKTRAMYQQMANNFKKSITDMKKSLSTLGAEFKRIASVGASAFSKLSGFAKSAFSKMKSYGLTAIAGITASFYAMQKMFTAGFEFNMKLEGAQNGIAGLIASTYELRDAQGKSAEGPEKFALATQVAQEQVQKLMVASRTGAANFDEMLDTYQQTIGPASKANMSADQARVLAELVANTAKGMGMAQGMSGQEARALIGGKIDKNATIGSALGFGSGGANQAEYKEALKTGKLFDYLTEKLKYMKMAAESSAKQISTTFATIKMNLQELASKTINQLSNSFRELSAFTSNMFDDNNNVKEYWQPMLTLFDVIGGVIGDKVVEAFKSLAETARDIGAYFTKTPESFELVLDTVGTLWETFKQLFSTVVDIGKTIYETVTSIFGIDKAISSSTDGLDDFQKVVLTIQNGFTIVKAIIESVGAVIQAMIKTVSTLINRAIDALRLVAATALSVLTSMMTGLIKGIGMAVSLIPGTKDIGERIQKASDNMSDDSTRAAIQVAGENNIYSGVKQSDVGGGKSFLALGNDKAITARREEMQKRDSAVFDNIGKEVGEALEKSIAKASDELTANGDKLRKATEDRKNREMNNKFRKEIGEDPNQPDPNNTRFEKAKQERDKKLADAQKLRDLAKGVTAIPTGGSEKEEKKKKEDLLMDYKNKMKLLDLSNKDEIDKFQDKQKVIQQLYENNKTYITKYYDDLAKVEQDEYNSTVQNVFDKIKLVRDEMAKTGSDPKRKKDNIRLTQDEVKLTNELNKLERDHSLQQDANAIKRKQAILEYTRGIEDLQAKINGFKFGETYDDVKRARQREIEDLKRQYANDPTALAKVNEYNKEGTKNDEYENTMKQMSAINAKRSTEEERINILTTNNRLSEIDGLAQTRDLRQASMKDLQKYMASLEEMNKVSENPALKNAIAQTRNEILQLSYEVDPLAKKFDDLFYNGLTTAMTDFMNGTKSAKDAFKDFAKSITESLLTLVNNKVVTQLFDMMFKSTGADGQPAGNSMIGSFFSNILAGTRATGGSVGVNKPYLVGEREPELFIPQTAGRIVNSSQMSGMMGGGNTTVVQNINMSVRDLSSFRNSDSQVAQTMQKALSKANKNS